LLFDKHTVHETVTWSGFSNNAFIGFLAKYYSARNTHGVYRSFAGSATYSLPSIFSNEEKLLQLLKFALSRTITRHPALCFGVVPSSDTSEAHFVRLKRIQWDDVFVLKHSVASEAEEDTVFEREIGIAHEHIWTDQNCKPGWKAVVIKHDHLSLFSKQRIDFILPIHHGIADGGSGGAFHKALFQYLAEGISTTNINSTWPYPVPSTTPHPILLEEAVPFPDGPLVAPPTTKPNPLPWTGNAPRLEPYISRVHLLTVSSNHLNSALAGCRARKITMTSLLHSLILIYLSKTISSAEAFAAVTPFSMRRFTGVSDEEMVNHISYIVLQWESSLVASLRAAEEGSVAEDECIHEISQKFTSVIMSELAAIPTTHSPGLISFASIPDYNAHNLAGLQKTRLEETYEISNIGLVKIPNNEDTEDTVTMKKLVFSQVSTLSVSVSLFHRDMS
jgi:hypothetical protein